MTKVFTIGGYGHSVDEFFEKLTNNGIGLLVDVRARRLVRGPMYRHLNAGKLQEMLADRKVQYSHAKQLAPTQKIRDIQKDQDNADRTRKRDRVALSSSFAESYRREVLAAAGPELISVIISSHDAVCFFCVEHGHAACHRSLITDEIRSRFGVNPVHL
ncbi:DUF488 domain-containing protein [Rubellimicrobium mesophilum]|uniref:DUF488 domain-containing protein n=1 Tax=Rubellimicrobium mesophilum TaxID=1123067 RepID=UPI0009E6AF44|nr:DUF488 domain-containing protein [Rubellimicrobium mesophilum]